MNVLLFGTFDRLHPGHENLFKQAQRVAATSKQSRPQLIAVIARDATVKQIKKHRPVNSEKKRRENLLKTGWVDKVLLGSRGDKYQIIKKIRPDIICLGYDQRHFTRELRRKIKEFGLNTKIVRLKAYKPNFYKSSKFVAGARLYLFCRRAPTLRRGAQKRYRRTPA